MKRRLSIVTLALLVGVIGLVQIASRGSSASAEGGQARPDPYAARPRINPGLFFVDYRHLSGGKDGVALIDLNPESKDFGRILRRTEIGEGVLPHHLYFDNQEERLYTTALGGANLYELLLDRGRDGVPTISRVVPIDTGGNLVGEDMYFTRDNTRYYVTFMGGQGNEKGGSVGVFDARTNWLLETIQAPVPDDPASGQPFIMHPHGISANEAIGRLMVTSTNDPVAVRTIGNTVTEIDLATNRVLRTHLVADGPDDLSLPVEVLLLRDDLPPFALVTTVNGGDIWVAPYDSSTGAFGTFVKQVDGSDQGLGVALEFYIHGNHHGEKELYVSFGVPGVVNVYGLDALPALPLKRTLRAAPGAHHMAFFTTESGRELVVVQNNLLNLAGLNDGSLTVLDPYTGQVLGTVAMATEHGLMPESIESAFGHGADIHH
jgi:DNA-binding beta-propeller fold protein YncE